jgi:hypothetical protein
MDDKHWWQRALALESEDRMSEAEQLIQDAIPNLYAAASVAELYAQRLLRLRQAGDLDGARQAFRDAERWIHYYASQATSGGEGLALSRERDAFLQGLTAALGEAPAR